MTASRNFLCRSLVLLACLGGLAHASVPQGIDAEREEARIKREFRFTTLADPYLTAIVARITAAAHEPLIPVHIRTVRTSRPLVHCLGNGAMFVSTGLLARLENDSQVAALLAPEIVEALAPAGRNLEKKKGVTDDTIGAAWLRRAGFDVAQGPVAIQRLRDLLDAEKQFSYGPLAVDNHLKRRLGQLRYALEKLPPEKNPGARVPDDPSSLRKIAHQFSLELAAEFIDQHEKESFPPLIERIEREFGANTRSLCLRANYLHTLGASPSAAVIDAFRQCVSAPDAPVMYHRELALLYRTAGDAPAAILEFNEYLKRAPTAVDAPIIKSYIEELRANKQ